MQDIFIGDCSLKVDSKDSKFNIVCYMVIGLFFFGIALTCSYGMYGDSGHFVEMHMFREPVYPLFLWIFRSILGKETYLSVVAWAQNIINAICAIVFLRGMYRKYGLRKIVMAAGTLAMLMPHIMTPLFSNTHLVLSCAILGEAICLPLFYLYLMELIFYGTEGNRKDMILSALLGLIISLIRGSMMICLIAWALVAIVRAFYEKRKLYVPAIFLVALFVLLKCRSGLYVAYNYAFNGVAEANMCGNMNLVTNILYASDREAGELIEDETTRGIFYEIYDKADADGLTYKHADSGFYSMINHLENTHDRLKFDYILQTEQDYYYANVGNDYLERNRYQEEMCRTIAHAIWPACFGRWLIRYIGLSINGAVRSVAVVTPLTVIPAFIMILCSLAMSIYCLVKKKHVKLSLALLITLMMLAANACGTATVIMCISRYMIYCFAPFYITFSALLIECFIDWRKKKNEL